MIYKCCFGIHNGLCLNLNHVRLCNYLNFGPVLFDSEKEKQIDILEINKKRLEIIEKCKQGIYPEPCINCEKLVQIDWDDNTNIKFLSFFHWVHCNCGCIYCVQKDLRKSFCDEVQKSQFYNAYPLIKTLYDNNLIEKDNLNVEFGGGEPTILEELPDLINLINENGFEHCVIMSSGIKYSKDIETLLQKKETILSVTIASGTRELYKKMKQRDKFLEVKENLRKYIQQSKYPENIKIRYLIYENYNDNEKDIKDWLNMCEEINAKTVEITIDFCKKYDSKKGTEFSRRTRELVNYFLEEGKKTSMNCIIDWLANEILQRGYY